MIPSVVDTILFIQSGIVKEVYTLEIAVKVPTGMTESDLARPVIEVRDFKTSRLDYEIYSYGEETVVIPIKKESHKGSKRLAEKEIEREFQKYTREAKAELVSESRAIVYVPEGDIARIIGKEGSNIERIENNLGISIDIRELKPQGRHADFTIQEDKKHITFYTHPGITAEVYVDSKHLTTAISSKKGEIKVHKKSSLGREILKAISKQREIEIKSISD